MEVLTYHTIRGRSLLGPKWRKRSAVSDDNVRHSISILDKQYRRLSARTTNIWYRPRHHLCYLLLKDRLFLAPLRNPTYVLDIGTGRGLWASYVTWIYVYTSRAMACRLNGSAQRLRRSIPRSWSNRHRLITRMGKHRSTKSSIWSWWLLLWMGLSTRDPREIWFNSYAMHVRLCIWLA